MAECHPVGFQWVLEAKARGARVIHVDPRFTRTSALADTYVPLRAGTDIAFLGGVIRYILEHELDFREYVLAYTNASTIIDEGFEDTEDLDGLFSGFDPFTKVYDRESWRYDGAAPPPGSEDDPGQRKRATPHELGSHGPRLEPGEPHRDRSCPRRWCSRRSPRQPRVLFYMTSLSSWVVTSSRSPSMMRMRARARPSAAM